MPTPYRLNKKHLLLPLVGITLLLSGCMMTRIRGSGNVTTENREISEIEEVKVCCGMKLLLTQGEHSTLTLEADDNILPEIETVVTGKSLNVRFRTTLGLFNLRPSRQVIIHLQMKTIHGIEMSGGSSLEVESIQTEGITLELNGGSPGTIHALQATTVDVSNSGGSKLTVNSLTTDNLTIALHGGSRLTVNGGTATTLQATLSGGSHYEASELQSSSAKVNAGGGSKANAWVTESLDVQASGGSRVEYTGNPTVTQNLSGGSNVRRMDR